MNLNKNTLIYSAVAIVLVFIGALFFSDRTDRVYGNDEDSIMSVIQSIDGYKGQAVTILEIIDIDDERIVPFLLNNEPAYIQFSKNLDGNYMWNHIEKRQGSSFSSFFLHIHTHDVKIMVVTNDQNEIAKMQVNVNGQLVEQSFEVGKATVSWLEIPVSKEGYTFRNYKYFDQQGNVIYEE
ncbi:hypothetical protein [Pseudalkalibacillus sp. SCS-8]|uniref:hypothetical protein n=1 Tax=Pseudalkalibacillus nanhaiensis TaxID=3115291 RepID=UPI0032DB999A